MVWAEVHVSGYVQGVGYRMFAKRNADALGLKGYVVNLRDGRVKILVGGLREDVDTYLIKLHEGPRLSSAKNLSVEWIEQSPNFDRFVIK